MRDEKIKRACLQGDEKILGKLFRKTKPGSGKKNDPNRIIEGSPCLYHAASMKRTGAVRLLLEKGADPELRGAFGETALHAAIRHGSPGAARLLLAAGCDVNAVNDDGETPLHYCVCHDAPKIAGRLLKHQADPSIAAKGETPLDIAIARKKSNLVLLLLNGGAELSERWKTGTSNGLIWAVESNAVDVASVLIRAGCDVEAEDEMGESVLHKAVRHGSEDMIRILLDAGADPDRTDASGKDPIQTAVQVGCLDITKILIKYSRNPKIALRVSHEELVASFEQAIRTGDIRSLESAVRAGGIDITKPINEIHPLEIAIRNLQWDVVGFLLNNGTRPHGNDRAGLPFIHSAIEDGAPLDVLEAFVQAGADLNTRDLIGRTLLHTAVEQGDRRTVEWLLDAGIHPDARDKNGGTALHYAYWFAAQPRGSSDLIELLIKRGADPTIRRSNDGRTPEEWGYWLAMERH